MAVNTENFKFKKPDESDFYNIQDQNGNWDKVDASLQELDTPVFEDYTGNTPVPKAETALENIKSGGKLSTIISNFKAFCKGAVTIGMIVNNGGTTEPGFVLDARYGKTLADRVTQLNSDLNWLNQKLTYVNISVPIVADTKNVESATSTATANSLMCSMIISFKLKVSMNGYDTIHIGDIPDGHRPRTRCYVVGIVQGIGDALIVDFRIDGGVYLWGFGRNVALPVNTNVSVGITYAK